LTCPKASRSLRIRLWRPTTLRRPRCPRATRTGQPATSSPNSPLNPPKPSGSLRIRMWRPTPIPWSRACHASHRCQRGDEIIAEPPCLTRRKPPRSPDSIVATDSPGSRTLRLAAHTDTSVLTCSCVFQTFDACASERWSTSPRLQRQSERHRQRHEPPLAAPRRGWERTSRTHPTWIEQVPQLICCDRGTTSPSPLLTMVWVLGSTWPKRSARTWCWGSPCGAHFPGRVIVAVSAS